MRPKTGSIAKITRPVIKRCYPRSRLFKLLDRGSDRSVIWVVGPPGSGKTTLLSSYVDERKLSCLWYRLDEIDGDIATFFYYLGLAAKSAAPRMRKPLPLLTPEYLLGVPAFAQRYFENLYRGMKPPFILVFDNYQAVPLESPFHDVMYVGLSHIPEGITVVLLSRADPPPVFARLHANREARFIGWEDLRLTSQESKGIVRLYGCGTPSESSMRDLCERVSGWAAGLVLMLESDHEYRLRAPLSKEHTPEEIFDYFMGEIFERTEPQVRDFLLKTAFLPSLTSPMAEKLSGIGRADRILSELNHKSYFTERRPGPTPVYQYHPLFREFLMSRAKDAFTAEDVRAIQDKAAFLLEAWGRSEEAAELFETSGNWAELARLTLSHAPSLIVRGRHKVVERWLRRIPEDVLEDTPWLQYWAGTCLLPFSTAEARRFYERAFHAFEAENGAMGACLAWAGVIDTFLFGWDWKPASGWIQKMEDLLKMGLSFPSAEIEARVTLGMFLALMFKEPWHSKIAPWAERLRKTIRIVPDKNFKIVAGTYLATYYFWMGELAHAALIVKTLEPMARSSAISPLSRLCWLTSVTMHDWHTNSTEDCLQSVAEGERLARHTGVHTIDSQVLAQGVFGSLSAGDLRTGAELLQRMYSSLNHCQLDIGHYHYLAGWHKALMGDIERALEHVETSLAVANENDTPFFQALNQVELAGLLLERGDFERAERFLGSTLCINRKIKSAMLEIKCDFIEARLTLSRGKKDIGLTWLGKGMTVSRRRGFVNLPWWRPSLMADLCSKCLDAGVERHYVQNLIRKRHLIPEAASLHTDRWPWTLKIFTLGRFAIEKNGKPIPFSGKVQKKPLEMLKVVIAYGGRDVREEQITDALWPEADGDMAHWSFKSNLRRLRRLVGDEKAILHQDGGVSLDPRRCWLDVWAFERMVKELDSVIRQQRVSEEKVHLLEKTIDIYRGHFVEEESDKLWAVSRRENLKSKFMDAVETIGACWEREGDLKEAVSCYKKGLEVDDLAEGLYQRLMICFCKQGCKAEALKLYRRCRDTLAAVLGVEPSPETERIHQSILSEPLESAVEGPPLIPAVNPQSSRIPHTLTTESLVSFSSVKR